MNDADLLARLGLDSSDFERGLSNAVRSGTAYSGQLAEKIGDKLYGLRDVSNVVATALGLNIKDIAENLARRFTGMSKDEEAAYQRSEQLSTQAADVAMKNMRARLTDEQRYQLAVQERDKLIAKISDTEIKSGADMAKVAEMRLALENKVGEIQAYQAKQREADQKAFAEDTKRRVEAGEKEFEATLAVLTTQEKIRALKQAITDQQAVLNAGVLTQENSEAFQTTLAEKKKLLLEAETKLKTETIELSKRSALSIAEELELFTLLRKSHESLTAADKTRLEVLQLQKAEKSTQIEIETLEEALITGKITPAERTRLAQLIEQDTKLKEQIEKKQVLIKAAAELKTREQGVTAEYDKQLASIRQMAGYGSAKNGSYAATTETTTVGDLQKGLDEAKAYLDFARLNAADIGGYERYTAAFAQVEQLQKNLDHAKYYGATIGGSYGAVPLSELDLSDVTTVKVATSIKKSTTTGGRSVTSDPTKDLGFGMTTGAGLQPRTGIDYSGDTLTPIVIPDPWQTETLLNDFFGSIDASSVTMQKVVDSSAATATTVGQINATLGKLVDGGG